MNEDYEFITTPLKKIIMKEYEEDIAQRVMKEKIAQINKWGERKDYDAMLRVVENNDQNKTEYI